MHIEKMVETKPIFAQKGLYKNTQSIYTDNNLKVEATLIFFSRRMNKFDKFLKWILYSNKKWTTGILNNIIEFQQYFSEWNKPDTNEYILCNSVYIKFKNRQN